MAYYKIDASYKVNLRTLNRLIEIYNYDKINWKELAGNFLNNDKDLAVVLDIISNFHSSKEQVIEFRKRTGKSRATFYKLKKEAVVLTKGIK